MNSIEEEVRIWNTPLVNGYFLWRFVSGYADAHPSHEPPTVILCVIALTIMSDETLYEPINSRKKRLSAYVYSFVKEKKADALATLHLLIGESKYMCIDAIDAATAAGVVVWDVEHGALAPGDFIEVDAKRCGKRNKANGDRAELLGRWFSELNLNQIVTLLGVKL